MKDKLQVQNRFDKASRSYDDVSLVQQQCAENLVALIRSNFPDFLPTNILDLGTGTAALPELLHTYYPNARWTLNDLAPQMLEQARLRTAGKLNADFLLADMDTANFANYDLIVSNLAMQWSQDLPKLVSRLLNSTNMLAFSCLLSGTFAEWSGIFQEKSLPVPTHEYPQEAVFCDFLQSLNLENIFFTTQEYILTFSSAREFTSYLRKLGAGQPSQLISITDLRNVLRGQTDSFNVSYRVLSVVLKRSR